ncbi:MAG: hypothetical protein ACFFE4_06630 [Candidatus Thorarchaeota archaeon]
MMKNVSNENRVQFRNFDEIYFPKNCVICANETESHIEKSEYGSYISTKDYKKDYKFKLPVCNQCKSNINLKAGSSGALLLLGVLLGIILGFVSYFLTYSIILSIAILAVLFIFPFLKYRAKIRPRIKLNDYFLMNVNPNQETVQFTFHNKEYAQFVNKINLEKMKEKEEKEKERLEKLAQEKKERERLEKLAQEEQERKRLEKLAQEEQERKRLEKLAQEEQERKRLEKLAQEEQERERLEKLALKEEKNGDTLIIEDPTPNIPDQKEKIVLSPKSEHMEEKPLELTEIPLMNIIDDKKEDIKILEKIPISPPVIKKCPKCGSNVKPEWKFCVFCSEILKD